MIGKLTMAFSKRSVMVCTQVLVHRKGGGGVQNKDFGAVSQTDLNAVSSYNMGPSLGRF